jgi:precorrin-6x reductase
MTGSTETVLSCDVMQRGKGGEGGSVGKIDASTQIKIQLFVIFRLQICTSLGLNLADVKVYEVANRTA